MLKQLCTITLLGFLLGKNASGQDVVKLGTTRFIHTTGTQNLFIGNGAGAAISTGTHNTFVGTPAGRVNTTGGFNAFFGANTGYNNTGANNTFIGSTAGESNQSGSDNTFLGMGAGYRSTVGVNNVFVGSRAGEFNTTGPENVFVGMGTGYSNTEGRQNTFVGRGAGGDNTTGSDNAFFGAFAGLRNTTSGNTFIGNRSGWQTTTGGNNTIIGNYAGSTNTTGQANVFVGVNSGLQNTIGTDNTFLGIHSGTTNSQGNFNTLIGRGAGYNNTTGSNNTFVGVNTGLGNTTGNNNTFIGREANSSGANAAGLINSVAIGAFAKVSISDAIVLGDTTNTNIKIGIGTAAPRYPLDVKGNVNIRKTGNTPGKLIFASRSSITTDEKEYLVIDGGAKGESGLRLANLNKDDSVSGSASQFLSVDNQGRVGLYSSALSASQVRLQISNTNDWADYVFTKDYPQLSLSQLEQFIQEKQHLPHLPSAKTMTEQGATIEALVKGLVQTQEEQVKYILELQKTNQQLQKENAEIKALLKQLIEKR